MGDTIFICSPALLSGPRGRMCIDGTSLDLSHKLESEGVPIGEVFAFVSTLYFRGKLTYTRHFGHSSVGKGYVITATQGLLPIEKKIYSRDLMEYGSSSIDESHPRYYRPLIDTAALLASRVSIDTHFVLLGSVATTKYWQPLHRVFGARLFYPTLFLGAGDMRRGSLLLQAVQRNEELSYTNISTLVNGPQVRE